MKRVISLALSMLVLSACQSPKVSADNQLVEKQLMHHNYVLTLVNGQPVTVTRGAPSIEFGENMFVSGAMCNQFTGMGHIVDGKLFMKQLAMTDMLCINENLSQWDQLISKMLNQGAKIQLTQNLLVLSQGKNQLTYTLRDWVY
ncbi:META domain-containing protein [Moellerella wisconsensis]|uniref:META domain-containing protein n=1 Tax=Moellerella wisconsensis TaxID=158849 RepID=A0ACD3YAX3_9GAMM|nr:META domain-containing protein [Moellerella wisconsensis]UNH40322.1 META domain-containing protein [Moellerella wisconsensis]